LEEVEKRREEEGEWFIETEGRERENHRNERWKE